MMKDPQRYGRRRASALAVGVVLAVGASLLASPASADGHSPWSPVAGALEALEEGRFDDIAGYFCEEQRPAVMALDFESGLLSVVPADAAAEGLSGSLAWTAELSSATPTDASFPPPPETGLVISGFVSRSLDSESAFELFESVLVEGADGSGVRSMVDSISTSLEAGRVDFAEELTVRKSETDAVGSYLICSEFAALSTVAGPIDTDG